MRSVPSAKRAKYARAPGMASHIVIPDSDSDTTEDPQVSLSLQFIFLNTTLPFNKQMVKAEAALKKLKEKEQKRRQKEFDKAFQKVCCLKLSPVPQFIEVTIYNIALQLLTTQAQFKYVMIHRQQGRQEGSAEVPLRD